MICWSIASRGVEGLAIGQFQAGRSGNVSHVLLCVETKQLACYNKQDIAKERVINGRETVKGAQVASHA